MGKVGFNVESRNNSKEPVAKRGNPLGGGALNAVLKARQRLTEKLDDKVVDDKQWQDAVCDDNKMFTLIQQLWLALQHFGEACLRTGVEMICDRKTRNVALIPGLTEDNRSVLRQASKDKIQVVIAQAKGAGASMNKVVKLEADMREAESDFKQREEQLKQELSEAQSVIFQLRNEKRMSTIAVDVKIPSPEASPQRSALKDLQIKHVELEHKYSDLQEEFENLQKALESAQSQMKQAGIEASVEVAEKTSPTSRKLIKRQSTSESQDAQGSSGSTSNKASDTKLKEKDEEIAKLQKKLGALQESEKALQKECTKLKGDVERIESDVDSRMGSKESKDDSSTSKSVSKSSEAREKKKGQELEKSKQETTKALAEAEKARGQMDSMREEAEAAKDECKLLKEKLAKANKSAPEEVKLLRAEVDELQEKLAAAEAERNAAERNAANAHSHSPPSPISGNTSNVEQQNDFSFELEEQRTRLRELEKEREKLTHRNVELEEEVRDLQAALNEMQLRVSSLPQLAAKTGVEKQVRHLLEQSGLDSVMEGSHKKVFMRLYKDFWDRCARLAEKQVKLREASMEAHEHQVRDMMQFRTEFLFEDVPRHGKWLDDERSPRESDWFERGATGRGRTRDLSSQDGGWLEKSRKRNRARGDGARDSPRENESPMYATSELFGLTGSSMQSSMWQQTWSSFDRNGLNHNLLAQTLPRHSPRRDHSPTEDPKRRTSDLLSFVSDVSIGNRKGSLPSLSHNGDRLYNTTSKLTTKVGKQVGGEPQRRPARGHRTNYSWLRGI